MIPMKKMTKDQAKEFVDSIDALSDAAFEDLNFGWDYRRKFIDKWR